MTTITFKGNPVHTIGKLPEIGVVAPEFTLTKADLSDIKLKDFHGKKIILNIFPSLDTPVCAQSVRTFNKEAVQLPNTMVICVSMDLPFAYTRFCNAEGINNIITASDFRHKKFGDSYGVCIKDGPLAGLLSRAVVIIDPQGKVSYTEQVPEITQEPNYQAALKALG